jgi:two-component system phosphate regulon response regulator OmpR
LVQAKVPSQNSHILAIDDDQRLRDLLKAYLGREGFFVSTLCSAEEAYPVLRSLRVDLILLDVMLPGDSGHAFFQKLTQNQPDSPPVIMLTAKNSHDDRLEGLRLGVDDYLFKPFDPQELILRVQAILKRTQSNASADMIAIGDATFHRNQGGLLRDQIQIPLTDSEFVLLNFFCEKANETITREDIVKVLKGRINLRSVDVQIARLRQKIEKTPKTPMYLQSIRGQGYILRLPRP